MANLDSYKITDNDLVNKAVTYADDRPKGTAQQNKYLFDRVAKEVLIPKFNELLAHLVQSGAGDLGASVPGIAGTNVQEILNGVKTMLDDRYTKEQADGLLGDKADKVTVAPMVRDVTFDEKTGVLTVHRQNGQTSALDTAMEKIAVNFRFDAAQQALVLTLADGSTQTVDLSAFVKPQEFTSSASIEFAVSGQTVSAHIKPGSVDDTMLSSALKEAMIGYRDAAAASARQAAASAAAAEAHKTAAAGSEAAADSRAAEALVSEHNAQVWTEGGQLVGHQGASVPQVHTTGAKEWAAQAKQSASQAAGSATTADTRANAADASATDAGAAAQNASRDAKAAQVSASTAKASETAAAASEAAAKGSESAAAASEAAAKGSENAAAGSKAAAAASAAAAKASETGVGSAASAAQASAAAAKASETGAQAAAKRAEDAATQAEQIVGGDFATRQELKTHTDDAVRHVTAQERTAWNAKLDASQKGKADGVASLDAAGKVPAGQLPPMNYDEKGSAAAVQADLDAHTGDKSNPHGVTAEQAGARPDTWMPTAADVGARPNTWTPTAAETGAAPASHTHPVGQVTGTLPVSKGGTGVSSMTGTDYTANRPRGMAIQSTAPTSVPNGCIVGVYSV